MVPLDQPERSFFTRFKHIFWAEKRSSSTLQSTHRRPTRSIVEDTSDRRSPHTSDTTDWGRGPIYEQPKQSEIDAYVGRIGRLETSVKELERERNGEKDARVHAVFELEQLRRSEADTSRKARQLEVNVKELERELSGERDARVRTVSELEQLKKSETEIRIALENQSRAARQLEASLQNAESQRDNEITGRRQADTKYQQLRRSEAEAQSRLTKNTESNKQLGARIQHLQTERDTEKVKYEQAKKKEAQSRTALAKSTAITKGLEGRLRELEDQRDSEREERKSVETKLAELNSLHVRTVSRLGTGLPPIAVATLEQRLDGLRREVTSWCNVRFVRGRLDYVPDKLVQVLLDKDLVISTFKCEREHLQAKHASLTIAVLMEMLVWDFLRARVFDNWLFGLGNSESKCLRTIEDAISVFSPEDVDDSQLANPTQSVSPLPSNPDSQKKAERWRTLTVAAMSRDQYFRQLCERRSAEYHTELAGILRSVLTDSSAEKSTFDTDTRLRTIFSTAAGLAIDFRAQPGVYWRDESVRLGDQWDPVIMENAKISESGIVLAVVVQSWLFMKDGEVKQRLCKTKVVVV